MNIPTHDEISSEAQKLWQQRGCPTGCDNEIWLEAERKLMEDPAPNTFAARTSAEAASESEVENLLSPAESEQMSIKAAMQKENARAPQIPRHTGPKPKAPETGKPLWNRPHSS
jgi:hypothetical protein